MNNILTLSGIDATRLTASPEAEQRRDDLIVSAQGVAVVTSAEDASDAGRVLTEIKAFTRMIEDTRQSVGAPVLDLTKRINTLAKSLVLALDDEALRIGKLVGTYNAEQSRIAEQKRRAALEEEQRLINEANARLQKAQEAGASEAKLDKIEQKAFVAIAEAKAVTAAAVAPKIAGIATRPEICFEVTNIHELYKSYPALVKLEPNTQAIKAILKNSPGGLPGIKHWTENKAIVR